MREHLPVNPHSKNPYRKKGGVRLALGAPLMRNNNYCSASGRGLAVVAALVLSAGADGSARATEDSAGAVDGFG